MSPIGDVPLYPRAQGVCFEQPAVQPAFFRSGRLRFHTTDTPEQVVAFYRRHFPRGRLRQDGGTLTFTDRQHYIPGHNGTAQLAPGTISVRFVYRPPRSSQLLKTTIQVRRTWQNTTAVTLDQSTIICGLTPDGIDCGDGEPSTPYW
jgi:hypothetical protein